jgi:hypothetical protein
LMPKSAAVVLPAKTETERKIINDTKHNEPQGIPF